MEGFFGLLCSLLLSELVLFLLCGFLYNLGELAGLLCLDLLLRLACWAVAVHQLQLLLSEQFNIFKILF